MDAVVKYFGIHEKGSTLSREALAGLTTFLTMSYIIFVNPAILHNAGMDKGAVFVATCLAAAFGSLIMGLYANLPVALAPGMGMNAFFTYTIVIGLGVPWQTALGAVFLSGIGFVALSLTSAREWIINAIPTDIKYAMAAGIGLFLMIIGLTNAGIVIDSPATLVTNGDLRSLNVVLAVICFLTIASLDARRVPGAILIGMIFITILGSVLGVSELKGVAAPPPDISSTFLALDIVAAFDIALAAVIISLLFVDTFETTGTLIGVSQPAGLVDEKGRIPNLSRALLADSMATVAGSLVGTSSTTSYVESVAGVKAGGRTGLTAVIVAILFLLSLFFAPLASSIENYATGAALTYVGCMMTASLANIDWKDPTTFVPCLLTCVAMPLTFSIATGIGFGFITYALLKFVSGKFSTATVGSAILGLLFLLKFSLLG